MNRRTFCESDRVAPEWIICLSLGSGALVAGTVPACLCQGTTMVPSGWESVGVDVGPERADVSALLSGDRGDVTADELAELVRLARLGAEVERAAELHEQRLNMAAALWAEREW